MRWIEALGCHLEIGTVNGWYWDSVIRCSGFCILPDCICLQQYPTQVEASYYLIEVSWVNVVYLIYTSSLWLCDVKSLCRLTRSPPCLEWLHPGVDKAWNVRGAGGRVGYSRQGTFSSVKGPHRFPFRSKGCHKPFVSLFCSLFCSINPSGRLTWKVDSLKMNRAKPRYYLLQGIKSQKLWIKLYNHLTKFRIKHFETTESL